MRKSICLRNFSLYLSWVRKFVLPTMKVHILLYALYLYVDLALALYLCVLLIMLFIRQILLHKSVCHDKCVSSWNINFAIKFPHELHTLLSIFRWYFLFLLLLSFPLMSVVHSFIHSCSWITLTHPPMMMMMAAAAAATTKKHRNMMWWETWSTSS